jgi:hypothetical protein
MLSGSHMSISNAETFIRNAKEQIAQSDINESLLKAAVELTREIKRIDDEVHRIRRNVGRRF